MSAGIVLETKRLAIGYRRRRRRNTVLTGVNITLNAGEFAVVLGPNGIGKSTLLRTLAGLEPTIAGTVLLGDRDLGAITAMDRARAIGVVLSEPVHVGALRARELVALGRFAHTGWDGRLGVSDWTAVDRAITAVGVEHFADRDCRELSDGERQRLNLARVLAQEPSIIVLDEPTAYLDVTARVELMALLRRLTREADIAVIASTHDLDLALRHADTAWLIDQTGRLTRGAPEDLAADGALERVFAPSANAEMDDTRPSANVLGPRIGTNRAAAVLAREGFRIAAPGDLAAVTVTVADDCRRWQLRDADADISGTTFAALATCARRVAASYQNKAAFTPDRAHAHP